MNEEAGFRIETDSLGEVRVPRDRLWGAQTQRSLAFFSIGNELMPRDMVAAFAIVKKASAAANCQLGALDESRGRLICQVCDEILAGLHAEMFPLHVWMTGSGTQFNMNVNEVISNRCCQLAGTPLGSKSPVHPNDHANRSHSSNDAFPTAMCIAAACKTSSSLLPSLLALRDAIAERAAGWDQIVKIGRTHLQDATPLTLGQEWSGFAALLTDAAERIRAALPGVLRIPLGGTAVGTGINAPEGFDRAAAAGIASATGQPFVPSPNKFAAQGSHDDLIHLHGALRVLAVALHKIACDIRLVSSGPRAGIRELIIPSNEPGSSIMPGKVNPTQAEALTMITFQVMANDVAVSLAGSGGHLQMNAYKPLLIHNLMGSLSLLADGCDHFRKFLIEGTRPDVERISSMVGSSLMLATALTPAVGYDRAAAAAHLASRENITLREAVLKLGLLPAGEYDRLTDPAGMVSSRKPPPHA